MKSKPRRRISFWLRTVIVLGLVFIGIEFSLRFLVGFCNAPLYMRSERYEYITKPNQSGTRFGNYFYYNAFSQRNSAPDSSKKIILGLGDSVINGGIHCDQDSIATTVFSNSSPKYQMLNISAGSWGPDNCAAYLEEKGTFGASAFFLVVSSHDAYDNIDFKPVVGKHPSYPEVQYRLAWSELVNRYFIPRVKNFWSQKRQLDPDQAVEKGIHIRKNGREFNPGFGKLKEMADSLNVRLTIYLHADQAELKQKDYNDQGKRIIQWANQQGVEIIRELDYDFTAADYRDGIHINNSGQKKLAQVMTERYSS